MMRAAKNPIRVAHARIAPPVPRLRRVALRPNLAASITARRHARAVRSCRSIREFALRTGFSAFHERVSEAEKGLQPANLAEAGASDGGSPPPVSRGKPFFASLMMELPLAPLILAAARRLKVEAYLVGGSVRDLLLERPCHDWDFALRKAKALAHSVSRRAGVKVITLDEHHRIYRLVVPRSQVPAPSICNSRGLTGPWALCPGRTVTTLDFAELQGRTIREDLARRDFTINSMAIRLSDLSSLPLAASKVVDPFGGQRDLKRRMLCALSRKVLRDDPLRLQRAFRFSAELGFAIEPLTLAWVRGEHRKLGEGRVACERVREELLRLLSQPTAAAALAAMDRSKLLTALLPEMESGRRAALRYYGKGGVVKHALQSVGSLEWILQRVDRTQTLAFIRHPLVSEKIQDYLRQTVAGFPRHALLKFAALLHDLGKPKTAQMIQGRLRFFGHEELGAGLAYKTARRLRFSNQECQALRLWVRNHMRLGNLAAAPKLTDKAIARYFRDLGEDGVGMILLSLADHYCYLNRNQWGKGKNPVEQTARELLERYYIQREKVLPAPLLNGHVLMRALRLKPGPRIGQLLEAIKDAQAEGRVRTREEAIAFAQLKIGNAKFKMR